MAAKKKTVVIDARESGTSTGRYADELIKHMHALIVPYEIILLTHQKRLGYLKKVAPRFQVIPTSYNEFSFGEQIGLLKQIWGIHPDLVHFLMPQQPILLGGTAVTTIHDLTTARFINPAKNTYIFLIKQWVYKLVIRIVAKKSKYIIAPTDYSKDDIARFTRTNSRKYIRIYDAADTISDKSQPFYECENKKFIMYVGRPLPHKNLDNLVESFLHIRQHKPELYLVLAGKKDVLYKRLEKTIRSKAIKNIIFTDFVTDGQLRWLYEHAEAYVFPSLSEGFGLPGLEAMVHGCPVVSSNATCLPEVYGDAAHYFDPKNSEDMAAKILEVISDKNLRESLIKKGYKQAARYSWKKTAEQTLEVYKRVLEKE